ncbi:MAG: hypothetical protein Ct9H300mP8_03570 [Gammaproteobacteria bacterium]|nr:MAG: hypothetical protein Ct9H300mP8_03570 [Gammaproteobacteria bacterium]
MLIAKRFIEEGGESPCTDSLRTRQKTPWLNSRRLSGVWRYLPRRRHQHADRAAQIDARNSREQLRHGRIGRWETLSSTDWVDLYQKNVLSAERLIQAFLPDMKV